ncbi:ommochrome-binding protein-like [Epargyreus clarus]|uniref:ommochrome-binding protein-like n=1 Tax=Epargyreus clarus TaxID=520877 RepID=UPI003C2C3A34
MMLLIVFALLGVTYARNVEPICDDVIVHNIHHEKQILADNIDSPYQLAIDYDTHTLFFSFTSQNDDMFSSAFINLKTNEFKTIPGILGGFANGVDDKRHIVYLGGSNGLYTFDFNTKTANHIDGTSDSVWQMFFKNDLYYTTYPREDVYVFKNGQKEIVPELENTKVMLIALNKDLDFVFANSSGLFKLSKSKGTTVSLGDYNANSLTADNNGNLYFSTPEAIYYIGENDSIEKIARISNIYGLAIDSDGSIIYASQYSVVKLKPTKTPCYVDEKNYL